MEPLISPVLWDKTGRVRYKELHIETMRKANTGAHRDFSFASVSCHVNFLWCLFYAFCCSWFSLPCFPCPCSSSGMTRWMGGSQSGSLGACCWHTAGCSPRSSLSCSNSSRSTSRMERSVVFMENLGKFLSPRLG